MSAARVAHVEMIGGASGNMLLGAFLDAGAPLDAVLAALRTIPVSGWDVEHRRVDKLGIAATYVDFVIPGEDGNAGAPDAAAHGSRALGAHAHGTHLADVLAIVERSGLTPSQRDRAARVYRRLAQAEARVHGTTPDAVHFHEVGAVDAILDVAATCVALDLLGVDSLTCSAFPFGTGEIAMRHGRYPNPPPATLELLRGAPTYDAGVAGEMVTTTGAAILATLVERPGVRPPMTVDRIGYGAGRSDFSVPNVLRVTVGDAVGDAVDYAGRAGIESPVRAEHVSDASSVEDGGVLRDEVAVLECAVDDMSPQRFELAVERVLAAGAHDVWLAPVTMKKLRPAVLFGAVAPLACEDTVARAMLAETTTLGVRTRHERRYVLPREIATHETPLGAVRVKTATVDGARRRTLEYDDVARIARERDRPFAEIAARIEAWLPPQ